MTGNYVYCSSRKFSMHKISWQSTISIDLHIYWTVSHWTFCARHMCSAGGRRKQVCDFEKLSGSWGNVTHGLVWNKVVRVVTNIYTCSSLVSKWQEQIWSSLIKCRMFWKEKILHWTQGYLLGATRLPAWDELDCLRQFLISSISSFFVSSLLFSLCRLAFFASPKCLIFNHLNPN